MSTPIRIILHSTVAASLVAGFIACDSKAKEAEIQAQVASQVAVQVQAKAADDRVAMLEQQVADMKSGKQVESANQETANQVAASHLKALDRQLAEARGRAAERRKEFASRAANPTAQHPVVATTEVPVGTLITVRLSSELTTDLNQPGDPWSGTTSEDVRVGNTLVWPAGTVVSGVVEQSTPAGRLASGKGGLGIRLTTVGRSGVDAGIYLVVGDARGKRDAKFIGGTAALGALVGILSDKQNQGDHALGGAAAGALAGTALAAGTAKTVIRISTALPITFSLSAPEQVAVR